MDDVEVVVLSGPCEFEELADAVELANKLSRFWASQTAQMKTSAIKAQETFILNVT